MVRRSLLNIRQHNYPKVVVGWSQVNATAFGPLSVPAITHLPLSAKFFPNARMLLLFKIAFVGPLSLFGSEYYHDLPPK